MAPDTIIGKPPENNMCDQYAHLHAELDRSLGERTNNTDIQIKSVPKGTVLSEVVWCSPQFYNEICYLPKQPGFPPTITVWSTRETAIFLKLENIYADQLWSAILKRAKAGRRELHFNFEYEDFCKGIGKPRAVCSQFLNELCRNDHDAACYRSAGKFRGIHWDVWGNGAFTTHFTW